MNMFQKVSPNPFIILSSVFGQYEKGIAGEERKSVPETKCLCFSFGRQMSRNFKWSFYLYCGESIYVIKRQLGVEHEDIS